MTVEDVNSFLLEKAIDAREYYLRNETKIDNKRYEEGLMIRQFMSFIMTDQQANMWILFSKVSLRTIQNTRSTL